MSPKCLLYRIPSPRQWQPQGHGQAGLRLWLPRVSAQAGEWGECTGPKRHIHGSWACGCGPGRQGSLLASRTPHPRLDFSAAPQLRPGLPRLLPRLSGPTSAERPGTAHGPAPRVGVWAGSAAGCGARSLRPGSQERRSPLGPRRGPGGGGRRSGRAETRGAQPGAATATAPLRGVDAGAAHAAL